ncbi:hypothetical protein [Nakamurella aerolata]|uniref:Substrate-binding family protein n=1 Tax=Nakamurella aerolata TaxID=1656892 RepID=A0A849AC05_9ACTN|nr:hypothetical protein [Nakamurella aerolata]NNG37457.1 hypothetical protein [Nakamurella aerolata]
MRDSTVRPTAVRARSVSSRRLLFTLLLAAAVVCGGCDTMSGPDQTTDPTTATTQPSGTAVPTGGPSESGAPTTVGTSESGAPTSYPPDESPRFVDFRQTAPGSAQGRRIGLISAGRTDPYAAQVLTSITEQADIAGAELTTCDAGPTGERALACGRRLASQNLDGVVVFLPGLTVPGFCAQLPADTTLIAVDSTVGSCQTSRIGVNDSWAGLTTGVGLGDYAQQQWQCRYDAVIVLTDSTQGRPAAARASGIRQGLASSCPNPQPSPPEPPDTGAGGPSSGADSVPTPAPAPASGSAAPPTSGLTAPATTAPATTEPATEASRVWYRSCCVGRLWLEHGQ